MTETPSPPQKQRENVFLSLILNIALPALILIKGADWLGVGPAAVLIIGLSFPLSYGVWDFVRRKKINMFSGIGFVSVLLTGGIGLLKLPPEWIAIKEAAVPLAFGIAVLATAKTPKPLVKLFLFNDEIFDTEKLTAALHDQNRQGDFDRLLYQCTLWVAGSFGLSAILNFILAKIIVRSPGGSEAFNQEIGALAVWSFPVIVLPCMIVLMIALFKLFKGLHLMTGLPLEDFMRNPPPKK